MYFQNKLFRALNVPLSRLESDTGFNLGRSTEITRDEVKFTKFVGKIRKKFTALFQDLLRTQLILKGVITPEDWDLIKEDISYDFLQDNHFSELKDLEILGDRVDIMDRMIDYVGKYYSEQWIKRNILRQSDREIEEIETEIEAEQESGEGEEDAFI